MQSGHYFEESDSENASRRRPSIVFLKVSQSLVSRFAPIGQQSSSAFVHYQSILTSSPLYAHQKLNDCSSCPEKLAAFFSKQIARGFEVGCKWEVESDRKRLVIPASLGNLSFQEGVLLLRIEITEITRPLKTGRSNKLARENERAVNFLDIDCLAKLKLIISKKNLDQSDQVRLYLSLNMNESHAVSKPGEIDSIGPCSLRYSIRC